MAVINFPDSPSDGDTQDVGGITYTYSSSKGYWTAAASGGGGGGGASVTTDDTAPSSPSDGDLWYDTDDGGMFVYYEDTDSSQWVEVIGSQGADGAAGATGPAGADGSAAVYATVDDLPGTASAGDQAFVTASNRLYLWNGSGWYNIALINTTPSISGAASSYTLASDGTATTVTITATDPEGIPITYSIASDTSGNIATVTQNANVFTITPSTNTANAGTFSLTFRASDGVNIASAISEFTLAFVVQNSHYTSALITSVGANNQVNNTFVDSSSNSHTITAAGNATQTTFSPYRHGGYSTYFDGSGDDLLVPNDTSLQLGNSDFTIEAWIYPTAIDSAGVSVIMGKYSPSPNLEWFLGLTSSVLRIRYSVNGTSVVGNIDVSYAVSFNTWTHIAVSRTGNNLKFFADGVQIGSDVAFSSTFYQGTGAFGISNGNNDDAVRFIGNITDLRVVKGTAVYTSNFTPPTERLTAITNTSLLTCHLPYIADGSTNSHAITVNGNTHTRPFSPYDYETYSATDNGGSMYFDGSGDYLSIANDAGLQLGTTSAFTVEFWVYIPASNSDYSVLLGKGYNTGSAEWYLELMADGAIDLFVSNNGTNYNYLITTVTPTLSQNSWHHIAFVRESTSNVKVYTNGSQTYSSTGFADWNVSTGPVQVGGYNDGSTALYGNYYISGVRFVKGTAVYTSNFTSPTAPLTAITNTSLLLNGTNAGIIDKSQSAENLTLQNGLKSSTAQTKYLSSSMNFTDNLAELFYAEDADFFAKDFTIEAWIWSPDINNGGTNNMAIFDWRPTNTNGNYVLLWVVAANSSIGYWVNGSYRITGNTTLSDSTWHHIAVSRQGSTHRMFIDGTLQTSTWTDSGTYLVPTDRPIIGNSGYHRTDNAFDFNGYMSDIRLTKGLARYTATFTPPTAALQG